MSEWGEGVINNNIGWGQGFNNTIGWGAVYAVSYSGETIIDRVINVENIINSFKARVAADNGNFEGEPYLSLTLNGLLDTQDIINNFKRIVSTDNGVFEGEPNLLTILTTLKNT
jgi:hypothetical protein